MDHTSHGDYPDVIGQYQVEGVLGEGGMGVVVAARHKTLGHAVAIKFLTQKVVHDQVSVARFLREAKATLGIQNEHVVRIMDVGTLDNGAPYMVMERLVGRDLHSLLAERHTLEVSEAVDYVLQACEVIAEAHAIGIVHRDLKPENLFLTKRRDGSPFVKVLDFGISKWTETDQNFSLTATASVMGSPYYMSPEQVRSTKNVDQRADVWALGVVLHELLSGETPFRGDTLGAIHAAIVSDPPAPLREHRPDVPPALEAVILRCLEKKAAGRYSSIAMLARALLPFADHSKDSVARILRDSHATAQADEIVVDVATGEPTVNERTSARSATVEGWGTDAQRDRGKRRLAQAAVGVGALALLGVGSFVLLQRPKGQSPPFSDSARVAGTLPVPAVTASATEPNPALPRDETASEPVASAPEVTPAVHASADVRRRPAPKPAHPAPATSNNKVATPASSPLDGRK
jgi:serine/threonine-protein kinase